MARYNASRTVVREALTTLSSRGLILTRPRHRPRVRYVDADALLGTSESVIQLLLSRPDGPQNVYQTRVLVERGLVRQATLSASHEDLDLLRAALEANNQAIGDQDVFHKTDTAFHGVLYAITGNPVFTTLHRGLTQWLAPQWALMPSSLEHDQANYLAHEAIFNAILERNPDKAEAALVDHLDTAWRLVSRTFQTVPEP